LVQRDADQTQTSRGIGRHPGCAGRYSGRQAGRQWLHQQCGTGGSVMAYMAQWQARHGTGMHRHMAGSRCMVRQVGQQALLPTVAGGRAGGPLYSRWPPRQALSG